MTWTAPFARLGIEDIARVGGKNASLGELSQLVPIPEGFAVLADAYRSLLHTAGIEPKLHALLRTLDVHNPKKLAVVGKKARELIAQAPLPKEIEQAIVVAYRQMGRGSVAVRSSATAEDLPEASFAGQQESFLNICGEKALLSACKRCFASLFTNRAIAYRVENKFDHFSVALSIGVQRMVRSDKASSGVLFTLDTESGFPGVVLITGSYGLGESVVQGTVNPDEFCLFKPTLAIIDRKLGTKATKLVYGKPTRTVDVTRKDRERFCLSDKEVVQLAQWALAIEKHYSDRRGRWTPMDIEWAKDGETGKLFIVQARPETVQSRETHATVREFHLQKRGKILAKGTSVGNTLGQGKARTLLHAKSMAQFRDREVLVTDMTDPDWVPIMRKASAIVTNRGGRTSHAAIVSRELGLPCVVGTGNATRVIRTGKPVTVDCTAGEEGIVYEGLLPFKEETVDVQAAGTAGTQVMLNIGNPANAFAYSFLPCDGVGLARMEFIISDQVRIHPMALVEFGKVKDRSARAQITQLTKGYRNKGQYFVDKLAQGIARIAAAFYPKEVIVRLSDFKTNEYRNLIGGSAFEPEEENPMIGWRGAARYTHPAYVKGFRLECMALAKVRKEWGLTNVKIMVPVCRTPDEGRKVLAAMRKNGLVQGEGGLEVYVMCEVPSNAILADQFCDIFDGFSIGSNDLTQLTLGLDRDSTLVASLFDERNDAVKSLIAQTIRTAKAHGRKVGICGDAPSTYPEFTQFLVQCGIDSISFNPDAVVRMRKVISQR